MTDSDREGSEDKEVECPSGQNELVGSTHETNSDCLDLLSPEFSSLVGGSEVCVRAIESTHRICCRISSRGKS